MHPRGPSNLDVVFPVLACMEDPSGATIAQIQRALPAVIPFVEEVTGLRYYPPPTLLVDDYAVAQIRRGMEVDPVNEPDEAADERTDDLDEKNTLLEIFDQLSLDFHIRSFLPGRPPAEEAFGLTSPEEQGDFEHVRYNTEGIFVDGLRDYLNRRDPATTSDRDVVRLLAAVRGSESDEPLNVRRLRLVWEIDWLLKVTSPEDRERLRSVLGPAGLAELEDGDASEHVLAAAGSEEFTAVARRYSSVLRHYFRGEATTLPVDSFPAYAVSFIQRLLEFTDRAVRRYSDDRFRIGFSGSREAFNWVNALHPGLIASVKESSPGRSQQPSYSWTMTPAGYLDLLTDVSNRLLSLIGAVPQRRARPILLRTAALTFGAFSLGRDGDAERIRETATRHGLPEFAVPPEGPKVLVSANAFDRLEESLQRAGIDPGAAREQAEKFLLCTLVHEHFHAALATGIDRVGNAPAAVHEADEWRKGRNLNEAMAAWAQLHFARDDLELFEACREYVLSGEYPDWPYHGAQALERTYQESGLPPLRSLVMLLREDPGLAQRQFDELVVSLP